MNSNITDGFPKAIGETPKATDDNHKATDENSKSAYHRPETTDENHITTDENSKQQTTFCVYGLNELEWSQIICPTMTRFMQKSLKFYLKKLLAYILAF